MSSTMSLILSMNNTLLLNPDASSVIEDDQGNINHYSFIKSISNLIIIDAEEDDS